LGQPILGKRDQLESVYKITYLDLGNLWCNQPSQANTRL